MGKICCKVQNDDNISLRQNKQTNKQTKPLSKEIQVEPKIFTS